MGIWVSVYNNQLPAAVPAAVVMDPWVHVEGCNPQFEILIAFWTLISGRLNPCAPHYSVKGRVKRHRFLLDLKIWFEKKIFRTRFST